jgi:hypothetical protein
VVDWLWAWFIFKQPWGGAGGASPLPQGTACGSQPAIGLPWKAPNPDICYALFSDRKKGRFGIARFLTIRPDWDRIL